MKINKILFVIIIVLSLFFLCGDKDTTNVYVKLNKQAISRLDSINKLNKQYIYRLDSINSIKK